jgi:hypothetical protein
MWFSLNGLVEMGFGGAEGGTCPDWLEVIDKMGTWAAESGLLGGGKACDFACKRDMPGFMLVAY